MPLIRSIPSTLVEVGSEIFSGWLNVTTVNSTTDLVLITIPSTLRGAIKNAFLDFNFAEAYNNFAGPNGIGLTTSYIQIRPQAGGANHNGIILGGDCIKTLHSGAYNIGRQYGDQDIAPYLTVGATYWVRWKDANALQNSLDFYNIQAILRLILA